MSYLQNRRAATTFGSLSRNLRNINVGDAQGSKMGPLHFIIYINDMLSLDFRGEIDKFLLYLLQSINEYNVEGNQLWHLTSMTFFKSELKIKVIKDSDKYSVTSPYFYIHLRGCIYKQIFHFHKYILIPFVGVVWT